MRASPIPDHVIADAQAAADCFARSMARQLMALLALQRGSDVDLSDGAEVVIADIIRHLLERGADASDLELLRPTIRKAFVEEGQAFLNRLVELGGNA